MYYTDSNGDEYELGKEYIFNSAPQEVEYIDGHSMIIVGKHKLTKIRYRSFLKRLADLFRSRSYYLLDENLIINIGLDSYVETRCLIEARCYIEN